MDKKSIANSTYLKFISPSWDTAQIFEKEATTQEFNKKFINKWMKQGIIKKTDVTRFFHKATIVTQSYSIKVNERSVEYEQYIHLDNNYNLLAYSK